jgi:hypothetical protein
MMIGFSLTPRFYIRLPNINNEYSLININIYIRNKYHFIKQFNISSIYVYQNFEEMKNFIDSKNNSFLNGLLTGNQNDIGQIIISISEKFEQMNNDYLNKIHSS